MGRGERGRCAPIARDRAAKPGAPIWGADRVHVWAEDLEEVGDRHVDRDGEHAELGRALLPEHVVVLEDAHLGGVRHQKSGESATRAMESQRQRA